MKFLHMLKRPFVRLFVQKSLDKHDLRVKKIQSLFRLSNRNTVKPVLSGHPRDPR